MPLQLDYRPQNLDEFFGNEALKKSLLSIFVREDKPHTFLFSGPSGCGKTTLSRIIAKMLGADELDTAEYNISNMRGIDTAREIITACKYEPLYGDVRVVILNECHKATNEFQNAMLEILEEPPQKVYFILCTTEPEKLLKTVRNRATTYHVMPLRKPEMYSLIDWVLRSENITLSQKVIDAVSYSADGSPRVALKILDQIVNVSEEEKQLEAIAEISTDEVLVIDICRAIVSSDSGTKRWQTMSTLLKGFDGEAESARRAILGYLSAILLNNNYFKDPNQGKRIAQLMAEFANNYYDTGKSGLVMSCYMSTLI